MKRDIEYQLVLLKEIEESVDAIYLFPQTFGMDEEDQKKWQHLQLLVDEGLVEKLSDHGYRLAALGYDALDLNRKGHIKSAIEKSGDIGLAILIKVAKAILVNSIG